MQLLEKRERTGMEGKGESEKSGRVWSFDARGLVDGAVFMQCRSFTRIINTGTR